MRVGAPEVQCCQHGAENVIVSYRLPFSAHPWRASGWAPRDPARRSTPPAEHPPGNDAAGYRQRLQRWHHAEVPSPGITRASTCPHRGQMMSTSSRPGTSCSSGARAVSGSTAAWRGLLPRLGSAAAFCVESGTGGSGINRTQYQARCALSQWILQPRWPHFEHLPVTAVFLEPTIERLLYHQGAGAGSRAAL